MRRGIVSLLLVALVASACAPGTDGLVVADPAPAEVQLVSFGDDVIRVALPPVPQVALPDLREIGNYSSLLTGRLESLGVEPIAGVEIIEGACGADEPVYEISSPEQAREVFDVYSLADSYELLIDPDTGAVTFERVDGRDETRLVTNADGSGTYHDVGGSDRSEVAIDAAADGSGTYFYEDRFTTINLDAGADGSGLYYRLLPDTLTTIELNGDGSGQYFREGDDELLTIDAHVGGTGDMYYEVDDRVVTLRVRPDGSWELVDEQFGERLTVKVLADGSGHYRFRGQGETLSLDVAADGSSSFRGQAGPTVIFPEPPRFVVADGVPELGTLVSLAPPCVAAEDPPPPPPPTIVRFDSQVLFGDNEHELRPEAADALNEVAPLLLEAAGRQIEINGHTDARGSDEYNQELSLLRAQAVADEFRRLGVDVDWTVTGFGESEPVAPNFNEDGTDDPVGQAQNRRVEIVIHER